MRESLAEQIKKAGVSSKQIQQFDIFTVPDKWIVFPEERLDQSRSRHDTRFVIILQNDKDNSDPTIRLVLIAPLSTGTRFYRLDYLLQKKDNSFLRNDSYIRIGHTQPMLKIDLGTKWGNVAQADIREHIKDRIFKLFALEP